MQNGSPLALFFTRHFFDESEVDLGFTKIKLDGGKNGERKALMLSWNLDLESLLSRSHRKKYGLSGNKAQRAETSALKIKYDSLFENYTQTGLMPRS